MNESMNLLPRPEGRKIKRTAIALLFATPLASLALMTMYRCSWDSDCRASPLESPPDVNPFMFYWQMSGLAYILLAIIAALVKLPFVFFLGLIKALKLKLGATGLRTKILMAALGGTAAVVCGTLQSPWLKPPAPLAAVRGEQIIFEDIDWNEMPSAPQSSLQPPPQLTDPGQPGV